MKLLITGRRVEVSKAFAQYVRKRFKKWGAFLEPNASVHVTISVEGYRHEVEVTAKAGPYSVAGRQTTKDMYQSVDLLAEKIGRQLMKQHAKLTSVKSVSLRTRKTVVDTKADTARGKGLVVETVALTAKPMTQEEAAMQLQGSRKPYLVFEDAETGQLAVIERQKDGTFTLTVKE
ncbi:ribosome-associated translation inhibitor RaiA [candidate division FCPU426 bacterium]|nr:ribosome-associated translation inhibitor RaiA [candidate division FCPU426 bacterium]